MACVEKIFHKACGKENLQVFVDEKGIVSGYCFSAGCKEYVPHPYGEEGGPNLEEIQAKAALFKERSRDEMARINSLGSDEWSGRKLRKDTLEYFGVKVEGETVYFPAFSSEGELLGYKCKLTIPSKGKRKSIYWSVGDVKKAVPFGWHQALKSEGYNLFITEGEPDAMTIYQVLKDSQRDTKWANRQPAVISLNSGASSVKKLAPFVREIRANWKQVVCAFDMDEPGKAAVKDLVMLVPNVKRAELPDKDANDALVNGRSKMLIASLMFSAKEAKTTSIVNAASILDSVRKPPQFGLSWPWPKITKLTRGLRKGETIYIGAGVKMGKGEIAKTLAAHLIKEHNMKIFMLNPEESMDKSVKLVFNKLTGKFFHDPEREWDEEAFKRAADVVGDKLLLLDKYQQVSWDNFKSDLVQAVEEGAEAVFIDPITNFTNGIPSAEANTLLQSFAQELSAEAMDRGLYVFIFCHLKAPQQGKPHERGGTVYSTDFAGSRAMMRSCNYMFALQGDRSLYHEVQGQRIYRTKEEINRRELIILEDREFGQTGSQELYWNDATGLFEIID